MSILTRQTALTVLSPNPSWNRSAPPRVGTSRKARNVAAFPRLCRKRTEHRPHIQSNAAATMHIGPGDAHAIRRRMVTPPAQ